MSAENPSLVHAAGIGYIMIDSRVDRRSPSPRRAVVIKHVVPDRLLVPVVRRTAQVREHGRLVPVDPALGVLVLVNQAERVPELVQYDPLQLLVG